MAAGRLSGTQKPFRADDVEDTLPALPKYMLYVVMSMLLKEKLLFRPHKGAYLFVDPGEFEERAAALWEQLQQAGGE